MRKFYSKIILFSSIVLCIIVIGILLIYKIIDNGNHYNINANSENLIIGHSHTMCAFNDSLIDNTVNLSDNGENYFYSFIKLKKILKANKNVKRIFISFTNNQVYNSYDSTTIWADKYINYRYPKYAANFNVDEFTLLIKNNPLAVVRAQQKALKNNLHLVFNKDKKIISNSYWGGYNNIQESNTDWLKVNQESKVNKKIDYTSKTLQYLEKIISLCGEHSVQIYFVRSPMHPRNVELQNEVFFIKLLNDKYSKVDFLDFKDFPISDKQFKDFGHLNYNGALKFSVFFNELLKNELLLVKDKQSYINKEINKLK